MVDRSDFGGMLVEVLDDDARRVRMVCRGRLGSQDSIWKCHQQTE